MVGWNGYRVLEELDDPFDASEDAPALTNHEDGVNVDGAMVVG